MAQLVNVLAVCERADYALVYWGENSYTPYIACWFPRTRTNRKLDRCDEDYEMEISWSQGHYFANLKDAAKFALDKEVEATEYQIDEMRLELDRIKKMIEEKFA